MNVDPLHLQPETEAAVEGLNGGPLSFAGQRSEYIVMRMDVYRD